MKVVVLSDTHIPYAASQLPIKVCEVLGHADAIIHAGDYQAESVIDTLQSFADFYGVRGNMDSLAIHNRVPAELIINLGKFAIGVVHGWGSPAGLEDRGRARERSTGRGRAAAERDRSREAGAAASRRPRGRDGRLDRLHDSAVPAECPALRWQ